ERDELVGPGADRRSLEAIVADLFDVLLRHDPAGAGGRRAVERQEVGPRLLEAEADAMRVDKVDARGPRLERPRPGAALWPHRELDVLGSHRVAIVKRNAATQDELVREAVGRHRP